MKSLFGGAFAILGAVTATLAISSIVLNYQEVRLAAEFERTLNYYLSWRNQARLVLVDWWAVKIWPNWHIPNVYIDIFIIWILCAAASYRHAIRVRSNKWIALTRKLTEGPSKIPQWLNDIPYFAFAPIMLVVQIVVGIVTCRSVLQRYHEAFGVRMRDPNSISASIIRNEFEAIVLAFAPAVGTILFFWLNSIAIGQI